MIKKIFFINILFSISLSTFAGGILPTATFNQQSLIKVKQLAMGGNHNCAILEDSTTKCWGSGADGMTLQGNTTDIGDQVGETRGSSAINLGTGRYAISLGLGLNHSCVVLDNGSVKCWGQNTYGQLGNGTTNSLGDAANELGDNLPAVNLGTGRTALQVAAGFSHTCAILDNHTVKCWGDNPSGELGQSNTTNYGKTAGNPVSTMPAVNLGTNRSAKQIVVGDRYTCALLDDSTVKCWGVNDSGQLGIGNTTTVGNAAVTMSSAAAIDFGSGKKVLQIAGAVGYHTCALLDNHQVKCWGRGVEGQLGKGSGAAIGTSAAQMGASFTDISLGTGRSALQIAAGAYHTCALLDNSSVKCWGRGIDGETGHGSTADTGSSAGQMGDSLAVSDFGTNKIIQVIASGVKTCVVLDDGSVKCVGEGVAGQMGNGGTASVGTAASQMGSNLKALDFGRRTSRLLKLAQIKNSDIHLRNKPISGAANSLCVLLENSTAKCWGINTSGQLGLGNTFNRGGGANQMGDNLPVVDVGTGVKILQVSAGFAHSCALMDNSQVKCWGDNTYGQLGKGDTVSAGGAAGEMGSALATINLGAGRSAVQIAAGDNHTCALLDDSSVKCWGLNSSGQLGLDVNTSAVASPTNAVNLGAKAIFVGASYNISCALLDTAQVKCWGLNDNGQLGQNSSTNIGTATNTIASKSAVNLGANAGAISMSVGPTHICVVLLDSSIKCWGWNGTGQLGQGNVINYGDASAPMSTLPAVNIGSRKAVQVFAGYQHTCFLADDSQVRCWGFNTSGQLGLGHTNLIAYPADLGNNLVAVNLGGGKSALTIVSGAYNACAVLNDSTLKCWGLGSLGEMGQGTTSNIGDDASEVGEGIPVVNFGIAPKN